MMNNEDMLKNIEYLREKANVSYEEAADLLERNDGNVMRVLVELEQQGRVYQQPQEGTPSAEWSKQCRKDAEEAKEKATTFVKNAFQNRLVIEKKQKDGEKSTILNLSVPVAVGVAVVAPYLALASAAASIVSGYQVKIGRDETTEKKD